MNLAEARHFLTRIALVSDASNNNQFAFFLQKGIIAELLKAVKQKSVQLQSVEVSKGRGPSEQLVTNDLPHDGVE